MFRVALYLAGVSAALAALKVYQRRSETRRIPVRQAAEMLQQAWANNHTQA